MQKLTSIICIIVLFLTSVTYGWPFGCTRPDSTEIIYRGDGDELEEIYNALLTCPNITTLDLDLTWTGCVGPSEPWAFQFKPGDRLPALQKLSLSSYDLEDSWRSSGWFQPKWSLKEKMTYAWKHVSQFPKKVYNREYYDDDWVEMPEPKESNLEKWLRAMDFSQIEDLHLAQEGSLFYQRMQNELPGLKKLSLAWANSGIQVAQERIQFIQSMPPLESLSISIGAPYYYSEEAKNRTSFPLAEILETHGPNLQSLVLKQSETNEPRLRRPMLSVDEISQVQTSCPDLHHLSLDIDRDASYGWPNATFDAITRISTLESLTLRVEVGADLHDMNEQGAYAWNVQGLNGPSEWFREPRMSVDVAEILFQDLRAKKRGKELKNVVFEVGDIPDKPYSGPIYSPSWEEGRERSFVCELDSEGKPNCTEEGGGYSYFDD